MICHHEASSAIINNLPCSLSRAFLAGHLSQNYRLCLETHATIMSLVWCVWEAGGTMMKILGEDRTDFTTERLQNQRETF